MKTRRLLTYIGILIALFFPDPVFGKGDTISCGPYLLVESPSSVVVRWQGDGAPQDLMLRGPDGRISSLSPKEVDLPLVARLFPDEIFEVRLRNLRPCARYSYRVGKSRQFHFTMPGNRSRSCGETTSITVIGDLRNGEKRSSVFGDLIRQQNPSLIAVLGDVVKSPFRYRHWLRFLKFGEGIFGGVPLLLIPGNHEYFAGSRFGAPMMERFLTEASMGHRVIRHGRFHIIVLDQYWGDDLKSDGKEWFRQALAAAPPEQFVLVMMHEPIYSFGHHKPKKRHRDLSDLLRGSSVDAVMYGHNHIYEHFFVDGIHYLTIGGGGAPLHGGKPDVVRELKSSLIKSGPYFHFLQLKAEGNQLEFTVLSDSNEVIDHWYIGKRGR